VYNISSAITSDAELILSLQKRAYESEARLYNDWSIPPLVQTLDSLVEELNTITVLKAVEEGVVVGSVRAKFDGVTCSIGRLIVEPAHQGHGIGTTLLISIESAFPNAAKFELFAGSRSEGNIRLYQRNGYSIVRTEQLSAQVTLTFMQKPGQRSRAQ
jgi:ribosomal protein S18 acetylase RimI-like enzyme